VRVFALAVLMLTGCADASPFECVAAQDCAAGAMGGTCESSGYCSFPDPACPSGRRYGSHAPSDIADTCVPPEVADDTAASDPTAVDDGLGTQDDEGDTTPITTAVDTTGQLEGSSSGAASSLTVGTLDDTASTGEQSESSTTATGPFEVEYVPAIAVCTEDTVFDPEHCAAETGIDQITIDLSDSDGLVSTIWVRFDLDDALLGADVTSAEIVFVVGPEELDGSTNTGELWTTEPFALVDLSSGNPATLELVGDDLGAARIGDEISWPVPIDLVIAGESLHLALLPTSSDGLDVYDANAATPPRLLVTAQ
jgi:hypothetical protein